MKKEYSLASAKFIWSKGEYGFQEVIDDFPNAKDIIIITFDISAKTYEHKLIDAIKNAPEDCNITIISNIPNRWETYYNSQAGENARNKARQNIRIYLNKLDPSSFLGKDASVFFDFNNHGKLIMTDSVAYIGSENFSEESKRNSEFGFIVRDPDFFSHIKNEVLPEISKSAVPYLDYDYTPLLVEAKMVLASIVKMRTEIFDCMYEYSDDWSNKGLYFIEDEVRLNKDILESLQSVLDDAEGIASRIEDAIGVISDNNEDVLSDVEDFREKFGEAVDEIMQLTYDDSVYSLADFNPEYNTNQILSDEYYAEAYEENLEEYVQKASDETNDQIRELANTAKDSVDLIISKTKHVEELLDKYITDFGKYEMKKVNPSIDNT